MGRFPTLRGRGFIPILAGFLGIFASCSSGEEGPAVKEEKMTVPGEATLTFVDGPDGKLRIDDGGSGGLPVVFVHGNGANRTQWAAQLDHLRARRRAVALDLRGHGESETTRTGDYSVEAFVDDVEAVVDTLQLERFVLVGHSFGGAVTGAFTGRHPDRVAGLLLVDPAGDLSRLPRDSLQGWLDQLQPETYEAHTQEWFEQILVDAAEGVPEQVLASLRATRREVFTEAVHGLLDYDPLPALESFPGPKLTVISPINTDPHSLHELLPDLPHHLMENVSHWLMMDRPEEFNRILDEFLVRAEGFSG